MKPHYKPITSESSLFKVEFQRTSKEFYYPWHYHAELELTFILSGEGERYVGNSIEQFYGEELVLLGTNLPHSWFSSGSESQPVTAIVIYLKELFFDNSWMASNEFEDIRHLATLMKKGIKVDQPVVEKLRPFFFELLNASAFDKLLILLQILQTLARNTQFRFLCEQGFGNQLNESDKTRINSVYDYVQQHYMKQITLTDIASRVNMSEEYFSRFFSKTMKKPFFEFLNEFKINRACKLLIETDKQISEVCYASGFESIPFFYRQFKKFKGCQPKNYRANFQRISIFSQQEV
ncbi:AraC family transcriptional regulator [Foetidibacter luteolus]|uniref:AraC family transcriptional regulator n=1 Tax=Foetidibacter luteolus TaxID=2608880 RepID=UPI00129B627C|nr:AraC family transcriptional regulator [Foetidibacter luteolus]